jgi:CelD/BcsL family acetyltransferase involved in cellulose biosynthesis
MQVKVSKICELSEEAWALWQQIHETNPELDSPYFSPAFAKAVAAVRDDAEVGVLHEEGTPIGFFPFHRGFLGMGQPLAGHLSDFHGVITMPHVHYEPGELIEACGLAGWDFDHLAPNIEAFRPFARNQAASPFIDLSGGFRGYEESRQADGSTVFKNLLPKMRKLGREVGAIRFEYHHSDHSILDLLLRWKRDQYQRTGVPDAFAESWTVRLLEKLLETQRRQFAAVLSVVWAGDHPVAAHFGMRSRFVWHYWFPAYDPAYHRYSPGLLLLREMMRAAELHELKRIDLGKGDFDYKTRVMTGATSLLEGSIVVSTPVRWARKSWSAVRRCVRGVLVYPYRSIRPYFKQQATA